MKYKPTPLNIVCVLAIGLAIYFALKPGPEGWGFGITIYLIPVIFVGLLVDFVLQKFLTKYFIIVAIELILLAAIYFVYCWTQRTKTLIIPDKLESQYVVTIYNVEHSAKLPNGWNYEIKIPENGILLTSSSFDDDLGETKMKTYSGINLNSKETELGWGRITNGKFICDGKTHEYQIWIVDSSCCGYSLSEIEDFKLNLQKKFCEK
ncbi:hypothetical protein [Chryseobacterium salivictor]|uniref:Uncharacterized protein n=1 Tax=Chryseobacterium salivictor TaxID=2547600 RepID=A0A4P6ZFR0_9FLAO|nr:hypothetical protein [Chryseobacterium salivictor]QBO58397.1 hypothetical protein NBC122_01582 [Chryseobacterium salivictor]